MRTTVKVGDIRSAPQMSPDPQRRDALTSHHKEKAGPGWHRDPRLR